MRIALAQINPTIGDIAGNARLIREGIEQARGRGAQLVVFPELAIIGYPPKDLLLKPTVIDKCLAAIDELAGACTGIGAVIGYPCPSDTSKGRTLYNAAALCRGGKVVHRHIKSLLPTYDVFDERRYFEPGPKIDLATDEGVRLGVSVCEDLWNDEDVFSRQLYHDNPIDELAKLGAQLFINCSASPFVVRKHEFRLKLMSHAAKRYKLPLVYCNQVGGNDELVFDGNSCVFDAEGKLIAQAKDFEPDLLVVDVAVSGEEKTRSPESRVQSRESKNRQGRGVIRFRAVESGVQNSESNNQSKKASPEGTGLGVNRIEKHKEGLESVYHALVLGLRDYCRKCGFKSIVLGLSGGIDSALTCALAVAALGKENVRGVGMPSRFSSDHSVSDARDVAARMGVKFHIIPIKTPHEALESLVVPEFEGRERDTTEENMQARVRGVILMAFSNKFGSLLVTTGNKSELAVGYCTLYGDMCGGLAIISDVPKTMVWELSKWINTSPNSPLLKQFGQPVIPDSSITKVPSAELRPNQTDQDSLPPYDVLDTIIERYVEREQSAQEIIAEAGIDAAVVQKMVRLIDLNEYKRKQSAPGIKVTGRAFGFGRRMPIAQRYDNTQPAPARQKKIAAKV